MVTNDYLETVNDSVVMNPDVFKALIKRVTYMKQFHRNKTVSYGISRKHTKDIQEYRNKNGLAKGESSIPGNLYSLPVLWNTEVTYAK
jgi:hypothetical protein